MLSINTPKWTPPCRASALFCAQTWSARAIATTPPPTQYADRAAIVGVGVEEEATGGAAAATGPSDASEPREVIYMRYDDINMKYIYLCAVCNLQQHHKDRHIFLAQDFIHFIDKSDIYLYINILFIIKNLKSFFDNIKIFNKYINKNIKNGCCSSYLINIFLF